MNNRLCEAFLAAALAAPLCATALGPHEILVLANGSSPDSMKIARHFVERRRIPEQNLVVLDLPEYADGENLEMSQSNFVARIWSPAWSFARSRGVDDHILAWVYSSDFPTRITGSPPMSLTGLTFVRAQVPPRQVIENGTYDSPLFAGPEPPFLQPFSSQTFDTYAEWLGTEMPLPAMMLGHTGTRGNAIEEVLACIDRGVKSDGSSPSGTVYFVLSKDIRSKCREWEVPQVVSELKNMRVAAAVVREIPGSAGDVIGLMAGTAAFTVPASLVFLPGAIAEHLTSHGADFGNDSQTKISAWIKAGATVTAGTVAEPMSIWMKFPHARCYAHYAAGCTAIESIYQSVKSPLQLLVIGEPMASPWGGVAGRVKVTGLDRGRLRGRAEVVIDVDSAERIAGYEILVDGRIAARDKRAELDVARLGAGRHTLRAVAKTSGAVRRQIFAEVNFTVAGDAGGADDE